MATKDIWFLSSEELSNMSNQELKTTIKNLYKTANRRMSRLRNDKSNIGMFSQAFQYREGKNFKNKDLEHLQNKEQLMNKYADVKSFLEAKSSTIGGTKRIRKDIRNRLELTGKNKLFATSYKSKAEAQRVLKRERKFWKMYNNSNYTILYQDIGSPRIQKMLRMLRKKYKSDISVEKAFNDWLQDVNNYYLKFGKIPSARNFDSKYYTK